MSNSQREVIQTSQSRASLGSQEKTATSGHPRQQDTNSGKSNQRNLRQYEFSIYSVNILNVKGQIQFRLRCLQMQ